MIKYKAVYSNGITAYLGDETSYSYAAASRLTVGEKRGYDTMTKVIAAVRSGEASAAVLPIENNVEGSVNEVYDALFDTGLHITKQLVLPVRHSLIAARGATVKGLTRIMSHPQAIAQCRKFLSALDIPIVAVSSTSEALARADMTSAAIAFRPLEGQTVLSSGIQDSSSNATRFVLLSSESSANGSAVSVVFDLVNEPGALVSALSVISSFGVNMTRIVSRPNRSGNGEYRFFVDFDFTGGDAEFSALKQKLGAHCRKLCILGRYDVETAEI